VIYLQSPRADDAPLSGFAESERGIDRTRRFFAVYRTHLARFLLALTDPTYDKVNQEADFFLEFIAEHANAIEWIQIVRERWTSSA
jgi:hypothetical protein